jgi:hypothetical protein
MAWGFLVVSDGNEEDGSSMAAWDADGLIKVNQRPMPPDCPMRQFHIVK